MNLLTDHSAHFIIDRVDIKMTLITDHSVHFIIDRVDIK